MYVSVDGTYVADLDDPRLAGAGWVTFDAGEAGAVVAIMPHDPVAYAARLYAELHRLDELGLSRIVVEMPPETEEWRAVRDRLKRAGEPGAGATG